MKIGLIVAGMASIGLFGSGGGAGGGFSLRSVTPPDTIVVFNAGSLARPLKAALDSFARGQALTVQQENAGSLEAARKLLDLNRIPDVIALADAELFPQLLVPAQASWYLPFARNRMVITYSDRSKEASRIASDNWWQILTAAGVEIGRSDPNLDPAGYRTLIVFQLAERLYKRPGLAAALTAGAPARNMRPKSAELTALVQSGELDYAWEYESVAQAAGLRYLQLPPELNLGDPRDSTLYAQASVRVVGKTAADTIEMRGAPIIYGLSIPRRAPHAQVGERFVAFLFSPTGRRIMRAEQLPVIDKTQVVGSGTPASVASAIGQ
jgi:molybdate/tungstate transport system substrate-binding protein